MVVAWGDFLLLAACARALRRLIHLPALLCCEAMVWAVTFLASPLRMLTAVDAERTKLRRLVAEMQAQMDGLVWVNRDLEEKLRAALREHDAMDALLDEMEDEHDGAVARIHHLEAQVPRACIASLCCSSFPDTVICLLCPAGRGTAHGAEAGEHAAQRAQGQVHVGRYQGGGRASSGGDAA
jgi:hypothetical protein